MKTLNILAASFLVTSLFFSCKKTDISAGGGGEGSIKPSINTPIPVSPCNNYSVTLENYTLSGQTTTFIWKIYNDQPQTLSDLKEWKLAFSDAAANSIVAAYYGSSSKNLQLISPLPGFSVDPGDKCYNGPVFTFKYGTSGDVPTYYAVVFNGYFGTGSTRAFLTSKGKPDCCEKYIEGVGGLVH